MRAQQYKKLRVGALTGSVPRKMAYVMCHSPSSKLPSCTVFRQFESYNHFSKPPPSVLVFDFANQIAQDPLFSKLVTLFSRPDARATLKNSSCVGVRPSLPVSIAQFFFEAFSSSYLCISVHANLTLKNPMVPILRSPMPV